MTIGKPNAAMSPASLLSSAFKIGETSEVNAAKSTQTMAAGIMAFYSTLATDYRDRTANFSDGIPSFASLQLKGKARDEFKNVLVDAMTRNGTIVARITSADMKADTKITDQKMQQDNIKRNNQVAKVELGLKLATHLHAAGIGIDNYVAHKDGGLFSVPVASLINTADPKFALKVAAKEGKRIPLDGKTYWYETEERSNKFRALPAQVIKAAQDVGLIAKLTSAKTDSKGASDIDHKGFDVLAEAKLVAAKAMKIDEIMSSETLPFADIDTAMINAFNEMQGALDSWNAYLAKCKSQKANAA